MKLSVLLIAATSILCTNCAPVPQKTSYIWLSGDYAVKPVVFPLQDQMMASLESKTFKPIELSLARSASGDANLPASRYYYLAKAEYVGGPRDPNNFPPEGLVFGVDVDSEGVAHISTFRLAPASEKRSNEFAVVLISETQIKKVVSTGGRRNRRYNL
ncbi:MAG: hypothetical protein WBQ60_04080 [Asticcacaulis sp.]